MNIKNYEKIWYNRQSNDNNHENNKLIVIKFGGK